MEDICNAIFELLGGLFVAHSCYCLYRDKEVKGISTLSIVFFSSWSVWNVFYYYRLNQFYSFIFGLLIPTFNVIWIGLYLYYKFKYKK